MTSNRRMFLTSISASLAAGAGAISAAADDPSSEKACLDYGLSFICNKGPANAVRFWIESRTTVIDEPAGTSHVFYQCGSCKSENTCAEESLFPEDNYDFLPILGGREWLVFRRPCRISEAYRRVQPELTEPGSWGEPILKLRYGRGVSELESFEEIRDATAEGRPIVAQTELRNEQIGLKAVIEYPVKTMNVSLDKSMYQVDTGPIAYPDLAKRSERPIECLSLAFVAFNAPDFADFVIEQPTPIVQDEKELAQVYHYSKPFSLEARNRLLALALPL